MCTRCNVNAGDVDELVPAAHMRSLYNLAARSAYKEFYSVPGGTHNDTFEVAGLEYYRRLGEFLWRHVVGQGATAEGDAGSERELEGIAPAAVLEGSGRGSGSGSGSVDEEGYLVVDKEPSVALPTMTKNFQVK